MVTKSVKRPVSADQADSPLQLVARAQHFRLRGEYAGAEPLLKRALLEVGGARGKQDPLTAVVLNELGVLFKYMGRFAEAGKAYRRALRIVQGLAEDHPENHELCGFLASLYHNLGGLAHARGRFAKGEPWGRRSVELRAELLGEGHPEVAADQAALAALLDGQRKFSEAEALYRQALAVFERHYGPVHYEVAVTLNNLAALCQAMHRFGEAEPLYRRALAIKACLLGRKHPDVAMTLNNLAVLAAEQGRRGEARRLCQRALAIFRQTLPAGHPKLLAAESNFARLDCRRRRESAVTLGASTGD
jgi:tetratricopeptide (TPR) repeat protein